MSEKPSAGGGAKNDPVQLKRLMRHSERKKKITALVLILPLLLYVFINFVVPVAFLLFKSIDDKPINRVLPRTIAILSEWDGVDIPGEAAFRALFYDLREAYEAKRQNIAARRLNTAIPGFLALISKTVRRLPDTEVDSCKSVLIKIDKRWGQSKYWTAIKRSSGRVTPIYLLSAFDLKFNIRGEVVKVPTYMRLFNTVWLRTFWMSLVVTVVCVLLGYPLAYLLANSPARISNILMILVLLPFWTSLLVRTTAWVVLLQNEGLLNDLAISLHIWTERIQLIHNRTGVYIAMVHILLPYMVLPLFATMKNISPSHVRAAKSLGANPIVAFRKVYFPQTIQGIGAGSLFVYILALGFWVTPALVGGRKDQMISYFVAYFTNETLNWGLATALSVFLLLFTACVFYLFKIIFRIEKLQFR